MIRSAKSEELLSRNNFDSAQKVIRPPKSIRPRPQSFAQKLRSTGKSVKGYINLSEGVITPSLRTSFSGSALKKSSTISDRCNNSLKLVPRCWRTIYYLLDLYATRPETKTVFHSLSVPGDTSEYYNGVKKYEALKETKEVDVEKELSVEYSTNHVPLSRDFSKYFKLNFSETEKSVFDM